ncbi:unnamed protein product [Cylicocyclus nassatus]|uniref:Uncharacterized protein n=1 Tax=Cylicocyclus nassatus TaxID=53992 RepID=A0AA36MA97_CYLNA|nr:unnamed protein product [Cylicocyclus nassatus]
MPSEGYMPKWFRDGVYDDDEGKVLWCSQKSHRSKRKRKTASTSLRPVFALADDSAALPWNANRRVEQQTIVRYQPEDWTLDFSLEGMTSASELEFDIDLPSPEPSEKMSGLSCSSENSDKSRSRRKEGRPLYVPPARRRSGDSIGKEGASHDSPKSPNIEIGPTRKNHTLLGKQDNLVCSTNMLAKLSADTNNDEPSSVHGGDAQQKEKKLSGDELLPRPLLVKVKEERIHPDSPPSTSESKCQIAVASPVKAPSMRKGLCTTRLNGRIGHAERKEHTYENIRSDVHNYYIDSHCHLDFIFKKYGSGGLDEWLRSEPAIMHDKFLGCIPNFIEPSLFVRDERNSNLYDMDWILEQLNSKYVLGAAYGCHPHYADTYRDSIYDKLNELLEDRHRSKILAIGECGLDYMKSEVDSSVQVEVFNAQLAQAKNFEVPLVIHCRSGPRGPGNAEDICLSTMKAIGLPRFHNIHRHCFTENWEVARRWMDAFDNVYFGFTNVVASWEQSAPDKYDVLKRLPLRRILLETDSPYFRPRQYSPSMTNDCDKFALPPMAVNVAFIIAKAKNMDVNDVIRETSLNVKQMYCIKTKLPIDEQC